MKKIVIAFFALACLNVHAQQPGMKPLFNGKDLKGWYSFLKSKGKNNDPEKVFAVEKGLYTYQEKSLVISVLKKYIRTFILQQNLSGALKNIRHVMLTQLSVIMGSVITSL